ncbi:MAG: hypothetical protein ACI8ZN_002623, partial [Bacteroidia bacterium]
LEVDNIYCLGRVPMLMNKADTIKAIVRNTGKGTVKNKAIILETSGSNTFRDTVYIDSLASFDETMVFFTSHKPDTAGKENILIRIGSDQYSADDSSLYSRLVNYNVYSHADPFMANAGGIGFNGSSGDFLARFYADSAIHINQIKVDFALTGRSFQLGIWESGGQGLPGKNVFTSDTLTSTQGTYVLPVLPRIKISGDYFVGIRQTGTTNVAFGYQPESPVRPDAFYFAAPLGDTIWVPFSPGFDFRFNIQPRIQVNHDVSIIAAILPANGEELEYNEFDSIGPSVWLYNYGFNDQNAPFDVVCEIYDQYNRKVYSKTELVTIDAEDSLQVNFDTAFSLNNYGPFVMRVYSKLFSDRVRDNDTLIIPFSVIIRHDVSVESYFDPVEGQEFEMFVDRVGPVVRVVNNGVADKKGIKITSRLRQGDSIVKVQTVTRDIDGLNSAIVPFDSLTIPFLGDVLFECFTWGVVDSFPTNDTTRVKVRTKKSTDAGVRAIVRPLKSSRYDRTSKFDPYVNIRNYGVVDQDSVHVYAKVDQLDGTNIYSAKQTIAVTKLSSIQVLFRSFTVPDSTQTLRFTVYTGLKEDQDARNDTLSNLFFAVTARDLSVETVLNPVHKKVFNQSASFKPEILVRNEGNKTINDSLSTYFRISANDGSVLYFDSTMLRTSLKIDSIISLVFPGTFNGIIKGKYFCETWHSWENDLRAENDTLRSFFELSYLKSVAIVELVEPKNILFQYNKGGVTPAFKIRNDGLQSIKTPIDFTVSIRNEANQLVYNETETFPSLDAQEIELITASKAYVFRDIGKMSIQIIIVNSEDQFHLDDTIRGSFTIGKEKDVAAVSVEYPTAATQIYANRTLAPKALFTNLGDSLQTAFSVSMMIYDPLGKLTYNSNQSIELKMGESKSVVFDSAFTPRQKGIYKANAIVRLGGDQEVNNDTAFMDIDVAFHIGIQDLTHSSIEVYPNPTHSNVSIQSESIINELVIRDVLGRTWYSKSGVSESNLEIDVSTLPSNCYILGIKNEDGWLYTRVIIAR